MQLPGHKISVDSYVRYCTDRSVDRNTVDWVAYNIRNIIKGEPIKKALRMPIAGVETTVSPGSTHVCLEELMRQCAARIRARSASDSYALVPVPNSHVDAGVQQYKTLSHVKAISLLDPDLIKAAPMLYWIEPQAKSHENGRTRSYQEHLQKLVVRGRTLRDILIYDDVVTSGSQLLAAKLKLQEAGFRVAGMLTVIDVLDKDGVTHSDICEWRTGSRFCI